MIRFSLVLVGLMMVGCVQQSSKNLTQHSVVDEKYAAGFLYQVRVQQVEDGMSESQVISIMGANPDSRSEMNVPKGKAKAVGWTHYNAATGKAYAVYFQFLNDKVVGRSESGL